MSGFPEGKRYIREYRIKRGAVSRYARMQVIDGKARRVGTASTQLVAYNFMGCGHLPAKPKHEWACPDCGEVNTDSRQSFVLCVGCGRTFDMIPGATYQTISS